MLRDVHIHIAHPRLKLEKRSVIAVIHVLDKHADKFLGGCKSGELSLAFLTDKAIARIHADFLSDPTPTDVITFEGNATLGSGGEICVSADTAATYAAQHRRNFSEELTLYVVHGWLHLAGYDDLRPEKKRRMRAAEKRAMTLLTAAKTLPHFSLKT
jgi:probable rRNA maturation factor